GPPPRGAGGRPDRHRALPYSHAARSALICSSTSRTPTCSWNSFCVFNIDSLPPYAALSNQQDDPARNHYPARQWWERKRSLLLCGDLDGANLHRRLLRRVGNSSVHQDHEADDNEENTEDSRHLHPTHAPLILRQTSRRWPIFKHRSRRSPSQPARYLLGIILGFPGLPLNKIMLVTVDDFQPQHPGIRSARGGSRMARSSRTTY